ncbi:MAG: response regulator transcription factor [Anaerolineales bacterium]|nr:response regulator transcription factor [Anaerolineales bacterium]
MTVTVLLVDDHPMIRQGLHNLVTSEANFQVVGEAGDGLEAIQKIEKTRPDILIIDMMMPNLNGLEVLLHVKKLSPKTRTIVFSMQSAEPYVVEALRAGADGYILKETGPGELIAAIHSVLQGNRYLSERLSELLEVNGSRVEDAPLDLYQSLTAREREILQMAAEGRSSVEIGEKLSISPRTAEIHRSRCLKKLGLQNRAELVRYAIKRGILSLDK